MAAKKQRSGRVTPKGTRAAEKTKKHETVDAPGFAGPAHDRGAGKVGRGQGKVARPITHNRGNR